MIFDYVLLIIRLSYSLQTSNDIIAGNGRERFMIELKFIEKCFLKGTAQFFTYFKIIMPT